MRFMALAALPVATIWLAWPRLHAAVRYLPVESALQQYYSTNVIPSDRLLVLVRFAEHAIEIDDHHRYHNGLSLLHFLRAIDPATAALERHDAYVLSEDSAENSLARNPAQSSIWLRLSNIRWILHEEPDQILQPWKMSLFTSRTDTSQYAQRIEIGLSFWSFLDQEGIAMLRDQLFRAWVQQPGSLIKVLVRRDPALGVTRTLIGDTDPVALQEMEDWVEKLR
jgi:hypothetical protein